MQEYNPIRFPDYNKLSHEEMLNRSNDFYNQMSVRRTIRDISDQAVPHEVILNCIKTAGTSPSGANLQPWHFVIVSNIEIKRRIREAAEKEEKEFYDHHATAEWLDALKPLGTDASKEFLEKAPYLVIIFEKKYELLENGKVKKLYYSKESVGISVGLLITAIHNAGLVSLTHTPSPMNFLNEILGRPKNEKPFLILVVGCPQENAMIPDIKRKSIDEIATFI